MDCCFDAVYLIQLDAQSKRCDAVRQGGLQELDCGTVGIRRNSTKSAVAVQHCLQHTSITSDKMCIVTMSTRHIGVLVNLVSHKEWPVASTMHGSVKFC